MIKQKWEGGEKLIVKVFKLKENEGEQQKVERVSEIINCHFLPSVIFHFSSFRPVSLSLSLSFFMYIHSLRHFHDVTRDEMKKPREISNGHFKLIYIEISYRSVFRIP
jgi:hypothetical protein